MEGCVRLVHAAAVAEGGYTLSLGVGYFWVGLIEYLEEEVDASGCGFFPGVANESLDNGGVVAGEFATTGAAIGAGPFGDLAGHEMVFGRMADVAM